MRAVMQESAQAFTSDERAMINRVLDLQNFTVGQIATPLAKMVAVEKDTPFGDALKLAREKNSRACRSGKCAMADVASPDCSQSTRCYSARRWICKLPRPRI